MVRKNDYIKEIDKIIGEKICLLRIRKGLVREQVAKVIGITPQQLYKYEKGINRVSVGRLALIAKALKESITYFYKEIDNNEPVILTQHQTMCTEISKNFMKIRSLKHQAALNTLIKSLVKISLRF